jgi:hypothetical protein
MANTRSLISRLQPAPGWQLEGGARYASLTVFLTALALYLLTMPSGLTWIHDGADGGDLITAAYVLGVPHPPGYPLYVTLGHLLARLPLGLGDVAFRFNLLSGVSTASAAALLSVLVSRRASLPAGLAAGLTLALGPLCWSQAVIAEVYGPNLLLTTILLFLISDSRVRWGWIGLVWGLSLTTHLSSILLLPLVVSPHFRRADHPGRAGLRLALGAMVGLLPFLMLPIYAQSNPPINWGNPRTFSGWWWLVSGRLYADYLLALPWSEWPTRLAVLGRLAIENLTVAGLLLSAWGAIELFSRNRLQAILRLATISLFGLYALTYNTPDSYVLLMPALLVAALLLGEGVGELERLLPHGAVIRWGMLLIPLYLVLAIRSPLRHETDGAAIAFTREIVSNAPDGALIFTETDRHTFSLWYMRFVEGERPDLTIVDRGLFGYAWYQDMLRVQDPRWRPDPGDRPICTISRQGSLNCDS